MANTNEDFRRARWLKAPRPTGYRRPADHRGAYADPAPGPYQARSDGCGGANQGAGLGPEELEFLRAVDGWRRKHRRRFPALSDLLGILRGLGWRKAS